MSNRMLDSTLLIGPALVGVVINAFLTGCFSVQAYAYFTWYGNDRWSFKAVAIVLVILELAKFGAEASALWDFTVIAVQEGKFVLTTTSPSIKVVVFLSPLMDGLVQAIFVFRLWKLSNALFPALIAVLLLFANQASGYMAVAHVLNASNELVLASELPMRTVISLALGSRVLCDSWNSVCVALYLRSIRSTDGCESHRRVLGKLILWTVEIGICTSAVTISVLVTYLVCGPTNYIWMAPYAIIGSVYANVMLAA